MTCSLEKGPKGARSRWGYVFRKNDKVLYKGAVYRYLRLEASSAFSRAYGRQAVLRFEDGDPTHATMTVGLDDLKPAP